MRTLSVVEDLTVCDFLDIIDSWKLVGWGKMGFKAQTCWTDLVAFGIFEIGPEFLISVQTGYFSSLPEPCHGLKCLRSMLSVKDNGYTFRRVISHIVLFPICGGSPWENVLKFRTHYSILFWPNVCFWCCCFLKYFVEWQMCRPWSDCSFRSRLIWAYTVCIFHFYQSLWCLKF